MNLLAHALLSGPSTKVMVGNLMGDFVKGPLTTDGDPEVRLGLWLHRRIDRFTDAHAMHRRSRNRVSPPRRRYAGVIIDLAYDHFLSVNWASFCRETMSEFIARTYAGLEAHEALLPETLRALLPRMVQEDWLGSYQTLRGLDSIMRRVSRRLSRENTLGGGASEVADSYQSLESDFLAFYPELSEFASREVAGQRAAGGEPRTEDHP